MSFVNAVVHVLVGLVYSPRDVKITCATGRASLEGLREINVARSATQSERNAAFTAALELSDRTGQPVVLRY